MINGEGRLRGQLADQGLHRQWPLKWHACISVFYYLLNAVMCFVFIWWCTSVDVETMGHIAEKSYFHNLVAKYKYFGPRLNTVTLENKLV